MKILDMIGTACTNVVSFIKESKDKALALFAGVSATVGATASQAAITFSPESGFSGSIETTFYTSAVVVVVSFLALATAIGYGIRAFKKG